MTEPTSDTSMSTPVFLSASIFLLIIWGSAFTMVDVAVRYIPPIWVVAERLVVGALVLYAILKFKRIKLPPLNNIRWIWYTGLGLTGMVIPFFLFSLGQVHVESGIAAIINSSMPLMTIVLAHFFTSEKLSWMKFIGFFICLLYTSDAADD